MEHKIEFYPPVEERGFGELEQERPPYYVEFFQWEGKNERWTLFKRNYHCSKEEWEKIPHSVLMNREVHPWNLGGGELNSVDPDGKQIVDMNTKRFLKHMVDALNASTDTYVAKLHTD